MARDCMAGVGEADTRLAQEEMEAVLYTPY